MSALLVLCLSAAACDPGCNRKDSPAAIAVGARPRAVAAADLDGDADLDVVVAESESNTAAVLSNSGGGRLSLAGTRLPAGPEPSDVEAADLDGDGDVDLAFANHETSRVTILAGDARGGFAPLGGSPFDTGSRPHVHGLATCDLDGDGLIEVAADSADDNSVRILRGGKGAKGPAEVVMAGILPYYRIGCADVARDALPELLVPSQRDLTVRIVGRCVDAWCEVCPKVAVARTPWMVIGADLNGDGRGDLAVVVTDGVTVLLGDGACGFAPAGATPFAIAGATEIAAGDLDGDGIADLAIGPWEGAEVIAFRGGSFDRHTVTAGERPVGLAIADLDGDGRAELIAAALLEDQVMIVPVFE